MDRQKPTIGTYAKGSHSLSLKAVLIFIIHTSLQITNLGIWATLIVLFGLFKFLLPFAPLQAVLLNVMHFFMLSFGRTSVLLIRLFNPVTIERRIHGELSEQDWYLLIANHLSYLDIILLIDFASNRIPPPKFFLKKELIWLPFVGVAAWALDMPFMRRYSREFVEKNPHLKGKDIETTRASCAKFKHTPTTVINFIEGTRFTTQKHKQKNSPFKHLLPPKAGGVAFTLAAMGELFTHILDVSLAYPNNTKHPMMEMLCGQMQTIVIDVSIVPVPEHATGDYFNDEAYRGRFQAWLNNLWESKDARLENII